MWVEPSNRELKATMKNLNDSSETDAKKEISALSNVVALFF